ncbi:MAG: hypothetical protein P4M05_28105 [Bradyrhizobium sp.]|nr:hypothetical protein [Bradyrhizobium sp.]
MSLHEGTIKSPRKRADIRAAIDHLASLGASDVTVTQKRNIHVRWHLDGVAMEVSLGCSPRSTDVSAMLTLQQIRRRIRKSTLH